MKAESECKLTAQREEQREAESLCADCCTAAGHSNEGPATGNGEILKSKGDSVEVQKDASILKFPSGNQPEEDNTIISKSDAKKCTILQLSEENSRKILLLSSAFENTDNAKNISDSKLQKHPFDSAKQLKLREFKYVSNPSMHHHLFQSFYNQLVSLLSSMESFEGDLLDDYKVHSFEDPNGAPNKVLLCLLLTYIDMHFKTILWRKETNGLGDKAVLALQAQCASLTSVEQTTTQ